MRLEESPGGSPGFFLLGALSPVMPALAAGIGVFGAQFRRCELSAESYETTEAPSDRKR